MDKDPAQILKAYKGYEIKIQKQHVPGMVTITVTNEEPGPGLLSFHRFCKTDEAAERARNELLGEARRYIDKA